MIIDQLFTRPLFEAADPNRLIVTVTIPPMSAEDDAEVKDLDFTGRFQGDARSQINQAIAYLKKIFESKGINFTNFQATYQGQIVNQQNIGSMEPQNDAERELDSMANQIRAKRPAQNATPAVKEVAPPGAKAERMVKHIKQGYARDGKLTPKEKGIAFATAWKAHNAGRVEEATGDERFDSMMGQIQREPRIPDSQMPPTDVKDLYHWAVKHHKPYHKIFAKWANREGFKSVAPALQKAGNLDSDAIDYWTPEAWKLWHGGELPQGYSRQRIPEELRDYLETVFDAYDRIVFDWPTEYRQISEQGVTEDTMFGDDQTFIDSIIDPADKEKYLNQLKKTKDIWALSLVNKSLRTAAYSEIYKLKDLKKQLARKYNIASNVDDEEQGVAEGLDEASVMELSNKTMKQYRKQAQTDIDTTDDAGLYTDSDIDRIGRRSRGIDRATLKIKANKEKEREQGVAEGKGLAKKVRQTLNAWMEQDQQYEDPTQRAGFQAKVWPYIQENIRTILADKGEKGNGDYPAAPYAAWLLVQHMDAYPQNQIEFYNKLKQDIPDHPKIQFLRDRAAVNQWILQNANNPKYYYNSEPLPNPTVNVRNPAMFKDAGIVATSRKEALNNAINAGNKLLVGAVRATKAKTQPSYKQGVAEGQQIHEVFADQGSGSTDRDNEDYMKRRRAANKAGYTGRETKAGTWRVFKDGNAVAAAGPFKSADEAAAWIKKHKQGITEMDKSQTPPGRDTGPRSGPEKIATPITQEKMVKHALDTLTKSMAKKDNKKKDVSEAYPLGYSTDPAQGKWYQEGMDAVKYGTVGNSIKEIAKKHFVPPQWLEAFTAGFRQQEEWSREGAARGFPGGQKPEPYTTSKAMSVPPTFQPNTNARGGGGMGMNPDPLAQLMRESGIGSEPLMKKLRAALIREGRVKELADDLKTMSDADFMKKYGKAKAAIRKEMNKHLAEDDTAGQQFVGTGTSSNWQMSVDIAKLNARKKAAQSIAGTANFPNGGQLPAGTKYGPQDTKSDGAGKYVSTYVITLPAPAQSAEPAPAAPGAALDSSPATSTMKGSMSTSEPSAAGAAAGNYMKVNELSTNKLGQYKTAAAKDAKKADQAGDFKRGDKRLSGMVQATKKQFDNDAKKVDESRAARRALMARIVNGR